MGAVHFSIDPQLVRVLSQALPLSTFVETGTFEGLAIETVREFFDALYTVELSDSYFARATARFKDDPGVHVCHGASPQFLATLSATLADQSVLYWLDAHWCTADGTSTNVPQCPLLEELKAINSLNVKSVILIDDARLFLCAPPAPHHVADWPSFDTVFSALRALSTVHELMVVNDVMIYFPRTITSVVRAYASEHGIDWLAVMHASKQLSICEADRQARLEVIDRLRQDLDAYQHTTKRLLVSVLRAMRLV